MTLEELKAAMDAAKALLDADSENAELKTKYEAAKAAHDAKVAELQSNDDLDESKLDEKTKGYIKKLRDEAAKHRTGKKSLADQLKAEQERRKAILKAAGIESEDDKPEEKVKTLSTQNSTLAFRNAILESAVQHGVPGDQVDYFEFLVNKATGSLEEGEELTDEALKEIVQKVKKAAKGGGANTTVNGKDGKGGNNSPPPGSSGEISLDKFCKMSIAEKSKLFSENQALYETLVKEAKLKKKLV